MKKITVVLCLFLNVIYGAQERSIIEVATQFLKEYQSKIPAGRNADFLKNLSGKTIFNVDDKDEEFSFINDKYYFLFEYGRRKLLVYQLKVIRGIPVLIMLNKYNDRVEAYLMAISPTEFIFKEEDNDDIKKFKIKDDLFPDKEYELPEHGVEEFNYNNPKVLPYAKNRKIGIKYSGHNIIKGECDSLKISGEMLRCFNSGIVSLHTISGKIIAQNVKSAYLFSQEYFQIINSKNEMKFVDTLGTERPYFEKTRYSMGNDTDSYGIRYEIRHKVIDKEKTRHPGWGTRRDSVRYVYETIKIPKNYHHLKFVDGETSIYVEDDFYYNGYFKPLRPDLVIAQKNKKFGVWDFEADVVFIPFRYDDIIPRGSYLLLRKNGRSTFYPNFGVKTKYKALDFYKTYYARFQYPNGRKGWVDREGNEFFD